MSPRFQWKFRRKHPLMSFNSFACPCLKPRLRSGLAHKVRHSFVPREHEKPVVGEHPDFNYSYRMSYRIHPPLEARDNFKRDAVPKINALRVEKNIMILSGRTPKKSSMVLVKGVGEFWPRTGVTYFMNGPNEEGGARS